MWSKAKWRDTSSYSRTDRDRTPREWRMDVGPLTLTVHRHIHYPGWRLSCEPFFDNHQLESDWDETAKCESVRLVRARLVETLQAIEVADNA